MNLLKIFNVLIIVSVLLVSCEKDIIENGNTELSEKQKTQKSSEYDHESSLKSHQEAIAIKWAIDDVKIVNGMMSFKDENEVGSFISFLNKNKNKEAWLDAFETKTQFKSLSTHYINQLDYLNGALDKNEGDEENIIYKFVDENYTYWRIDDKDPENAELVQNYDFGKHYLVANENLQFMLSGKVVTIDKASADDGYTYVYENEAVNKMATCGLPDDEVQIIMTKNEKWCKNDRRVKLKASILGRNENSVSVEAGFTIFLRGQKKASCIWFNYKTDLEVTDASAELSVEMPNGTAVMPLFGGNLSIADFTGDDVYNISGFDGDVYIKPSGQTADVEPPNFSKVNAKGTSRGMSGILAIMDCEI